MYKRQDLFNSATKELFAFTRKPKLLLGRKPKLTKKTGEGDFLSHVTLGVEQFQCHPVCSRNQHTLFYPIYLNILDCSKMEHVIHM